MEKIYLVGLIIGLCLVVVAAGVGFYFYQQTAVKPTTNNVTSAGLPNGNQPVNALSAEKVKQQSLPLILKLDNQDFVKIWAIEKTSLGAKPNLHDLLNQITPVLQSKIGEPTQLLGYAFILYKVNSQGSYYEFELLYRSQTRKWQSGDPVLYRVNYNYDIIKCADGQGNLGLLCINEGMSSDVTVVADSSNQTIIISEPLTADSQMSFSNLSLVQPQSIKLDIPDILKKINSSSFKTIRFTAMPQQGQYWFVAGGKIKDDPNATFEKSNIPK